jgi:hypothetical protein
MLKDALEANRRTLKFHATHLEMMNDMNEGSYIWNVFFTSSRKKIDLKEEWGKYYQNSTPYIVSFINPESKNDKGSIPMWKMYGANGEGAYFRFDKGQLMTYCQEKSFKLEKCEYAKIVERNNKVKELNKTVNQENFEKLLHDCTFTKSADWEYEKEWRILITLPESEALVKTTRRGVVEYVEVAIPIEALTCICLGPMATNNSQLSLSCLVKRINDAFQTSISVKKSTLTIHF